jgi:hypothetical protein
LQGGSGDLAAQDGDLVAEDEQLDVFRRLAPHPEGHQLQRPPGQDVDHGPPHGHQGCLTTGAGCGRGGGRNQGSITKTGNTHARRLLVEAAWHHQRLLRPASTAVALRRAKVSPAVRARGLAADQRLHRRWAGLTAPGKEPSVIAVAVARELAGWCWSLATMDG